VLSPSVDNDCVRTTFGNHVDDAHPSSISANLSVCQAPDPATVTSEELLPIAPVNLSPFETDVFLRELAEIWGDAPMGESLMPVDELVCEPVVEEVVEDDFEDTVVMKIVDEQSFKSSIETEVSDEKIESIVLLDKLSDIGESLSTEPADVASRFDREFAAHEQNQCDFKLGALLVELGLITKDFLDECIMMSVDMSISLGRVLIMSGWLTGKQLQWAIQLQALLRDGLITRAGAAQVAELMTCSGMTIQRALNCAGHPEALLALETRATRIGDLLIEADIVSADNFNEALNKAQILGLPVGRFLLISGLVAEPLLETVINAQRLVREGKILRDDAIIAIRRTAERHKNNQLSVTAEYARMPLRAMRLGDLLTLAGIVTEAHIEHAVEFGLRCNIPVGQVLVDLEILSPYILEVALTLQSLVTRGSLEPLDATYALIDIHHHGHTLTEALRKNRDLNTDRRSLSFEQFLASVELITVPQVEEAIETARRSPIFVSKALVFSGALAEETAQVALLCHFYAREAMLTAEESLLLFNLCHRTGVAVEEGLRELGLKLRSKAVPVKKSA